jgi:glutathione S-transferase
MGLTRNIPVIEVPAGKILTQSYVILRHWGKQLGAFDGKAEEEKNWADAICDVSLVVSIL